jgi:anti-sigma B factor antagonist
LFFGEAKAPARLLRGGQADREGLIVDSGEGRKYYQAAKRRQFPAEGKGCKPRDSSTGVIRDADPEAEECPMILEVRKKQATPEIVVLELHGRLLMGNDSRQVEWSISEAMKEGAKKVVIDLRELDAIDSTGVGILVMCNAKLQKAGGVMRIVSSDGIVESTLQMTHVDRIVKFFETVEAASEKFEAASGG